MHVLTNGKQQTVAGITRCQASKVIMAAAWLATPTPTWHTHTRGICVRDSASLCAACLLVWLAGMCLGRVC